VKSVTADVTINAILISTWFTTLTAKDGIAGMLLYVASTCCRHGFISQRVRLQYFSGPLRVAERVVVALRLVVTGGLPLPRRRHELVAALGSTVIGNLED